MLEWDISDLAAAADLSREAIGKIENGHSQARGATLSRIARAFDIAGVEFVENEGVRMKSQEVEIFIGPDRFQDFADFMMVHLRRRGGDVCVSAVNEKLFRAYRRDFDAYKKNMKELVDSGKITVRILATESYFTSDWAQYRWQPEQSSTPTAFYAFGDCLALISFDNDPAPYVVLHKKGPFAEAYRKSFELAWANAKQPPQSAQ